MRIAGLVVVAALGFGLVARAEPPAPPAGLASTLDGLAAFHLAEGGRHLKGVALEIEHLDVAIGEGMAVPVLAKDGRITGLYFAGSGGWSYKASGAGERVILKSNVERNAPGLRSSPDGVGDYFRGMLVVFADPLWTPEWEPAPPEPYPADVPKRFEESLRLVLAGTPELDFRIAQARLGGRGRFAYVEFDGGSERIAYQLDEVNSGLEELFSFRKLVSFDVRFSEQLVEHRLPDATDGTVAAPGLRHLDVAIATEDNRSGTIDSDLRVHVSRSAGARVLHFLLANNLDPDAKSWFSKKNVLNVLRVTDGDGHDLPYAHRYHELLVEVPPIDGPEADLRLRVETEGEVFLNIRGYHSDNYFSFMQNRWYPTTSWSDEQFTYGIKVRTRKPWRAAVSGRQVSFSEAGDYFETESLSDHASRIIAVMGGKYVTREESIDGRVIRVHGYAMARKNVLDNMPKLSGAFIRFYSEILGPMPAEELDIVEVPEYGFGVSPSGLILLTTEAYKPHEEIANFFVGGINSRLAHEIAHQWFGHKAVPLHPEDDWLSESLAEYYSGLAMGAMQGDKKGIVGFQDMVASWRGMAPTCDQLGSIADAYALGSESRFWDRFCLLYSRGPLVLHMLRTLIGNERFYAATKAYLDKADNGTASTDDFAKAVSGVVDDDVGWFFDDWIRQGGTPDVKVNHKVVRAPEGVHLTGTVTESGSGGFKRLYVPLVLEYGSRNEVRLVFVDRPQTTFDFRLDTQPKDIKIDPSHNNLVRYR